jgi:hypothetical protein
MRSFVRVLFVVALVCSLAALAGCSSKTPVAPEKPADSGSPTFTPGGTQQPPLARKARAVGYFADGEKVVPVRLEAVASDPTAVLEELVAGPTQEARDAGYTSAIPAETRVNSVTTSSDTVTVDLSPEFGSGGGSLSMQMRVAQIVFTLTRDPAVKKVVFKMDGEPIKALGGEGLILDKPQTRDDWETFSPEILVESPVLGDTIESPVVIYGTANVFEALFKLEILNAEGSTVSTARMKATSGTGTRGSWETTQTVELPSGSQATISALYNSPRDGSRVLVMDVPVLVK